MANCHAPAPRLHGRTIDIGFSCEVTADEAALGFELVDLGGGFGVLVCARLGSGIRAVKIEERGLVRYAICNDALTVLYQEARYLPELKRRFGLGDRRTR